MKKIIDHFHQQDTVMHALFISMPTRIIRPTIHAEQFFHKLMEDIIGQQLSVKVADVIIKRFELLFPIHPISPQAIIDMEGQTMRDIGMSWSKVKYVKDLAEKTLSGSIRYDHIPMMSDEEVITELTQVKGIGRWTAEMFLIFTLGREDVFSFGDLGLRRAIEKHYNFPKDTKPELFVNIVEKWKPYRSHSALALWHSLDNKPSA